MSSLNRIFTIPIILATLCAYTSPSFAQQLRRWTDRTGRFSIDADFVEATESTVKLRRADGTVLSVSSEKLSDADQQYIQELRDASSANEGSGAVLTDDFPLPPTDEHGRIGVFFERQGVSATCFSPDAGFLYVGSAANVISALDLRQPQSAPVSLKLNAVRSINAIHALPDGRVIVVGRGNLVLVLRLQDGAWKVLETVDQFQTAKNSGYYVTSSALSADGAWFAVANIGYELRIAKTATWELTKEFHGLPKEVISMAFAPHGEQLVAASQAGYSIIRPETGEVLASRATNLGDPVVSSNGQWMMFANPQALPLFATATGKQLRSAAVTTTPEAAVFSPNERLLAESEASKIRLLQLPDFKPVGEMVSQQSFAAGKLSRGQLLFSPCHRLLAVHSGSALSSLEIFRVMWQARQLIGVVQVRPGFGKRWVGRCLRAASVTSPPASELRQTAVGNRGTHCPRRRPLNADGCGSVMMALKARGARCALCR